MDKTYNSASLDDPMLEGFEAYTRPSDEELPYWDRYTVISRSRSLAINNPLAKACIDVLLSHVIGAGLVPQVVGNESLEQEFIAWAETHEFGIYKSLYQLQELVLRTVLVSGDCLVNLVINSNDTLSVQLVEPERVVNPGFAPNTPLLRNGVELNSEGTPIKYHMLSSHPAEPTGYTHQVVDAKNGTMTKTWLVFKPDRPDQHRGIPIFAPVMGKLKILDRYISSELMASVISSNFCVFVESDSSHNPLGTPTDAVTSDNDTVPQLKMRPGMVVQLAPGEKITTVNPTRPNANLEAFVLALQRIICAGLGLSHEVVTMSFGSNYSASKAAMAQNWKTIMYWRRLIIQYFCTPIFDYWCAYNGYGKHKVEWQGSSRVILDDAKEVAAAKTRVDLGISSRQEECEELRGKSWEIVHQKLETERALGYATTGQQQDNPNGDADN